MASLNFRSFESPPECASLRGPDLVRRVFLNGIGRAAVSSAGACHERPVWSPYPHHYQTDARRSIRNLRPPTTYPSPASAARDRYVRLRQCKRSVANPSGFQSRKPDVVVIDLHLPQGAGVRAMNARTTMSPRTPLVVLADYAGEADAAPGARAGATVIIAKLLASEQVIPAIRRAIATTQGSPTPPISTASHLDGLAHAAHGWLGGSGGHS